MPVNIPPKSILSILSYAENIRKTSKFWSFLAIFDHFRSCRLMHKMNYVKILPKMCHFGHIVKEFPRVNRRLFFAIFWRFFALFLFSACTHEPKNAVFELFLDEIFGSRLALGGGCGPKTPPPKPMRFKNLDTFFE